MTLIERLRGWLVADYIEAYTTGSTLIREAADEIERLTAENAALRADAERVDFLAAVKGGVTICAPNTHGGVDDKWLVEYDDDPERNGNFEECFGDTLRDAIDAARKA